MSNLIGLMVKSFHYGELFCEGEIVAVFPEAVWILSLSGFITRCDPSSIRISNEED